MNNVTFIKLEKKKQLQTQLFCNKLCPNFSITKQCPLATSFDQLQCLQLERETFLKGEMFRADLPHSFAFISFQLQVSVVTHINYVLDFLLQQNLTPVLIVHQ